MKKNHNNAFLLFIVFSAALGGFLFGYDTAVISGTITFVTNQFELNTIQQGWFVSSALVGSIFGASIAGELADRFGRKYVLIFAGLLFFVSAIGCAISANYVELVLFRIVGGIGVGTASMVSPLYISELSPAAIRGRMVALYQFAITLGILLAYFMNSYLLQQSMEIATYQGLAEKVFVNEVWRAMFGSEAIPALVFTLLMIIVPLSPRWLTIKKRYLNALNILKKVNGSNDIAQTELENIQKAIANEPEGAWEDLFKKGIRIALICGIALAILSQVTGINAIIYYGPRIMEAAGLQISDALGGQVIIGVVNVLATIVAIVTIDKIGRKKLMRGGAFVMFFSLIGVGLLFLLGQTQGFITLLFILIFIIGYAVGYGPVVWVLLSEIYPNKIRGRAMSVAIFTIWISTALIGQVVPWMLAAIGPSGTFFIFALFCIPILFVLRFLPETKEKSLEEIEKYWTQQ